MQAHCTTCCILLTDCISFLLQVVYEFCSFVLDSKPTSVTADEAELSKLKRATPTTQQEERQLLAIQYRIGKKKILQSCIRKHKKIAKQFFQR